MTSITRLLALNPVEALVAMVNSANNKNYYVSGVSASLPTNLGGTSTQVTLTGNAFGAPFASDLPSGSITITYNRLDMSSFLQGVLDDYRPTLPLSTQNILDEITSLIGQDFYIDDMVLEEVTRDNGVTYLLKAKPESLRWVGSIGLPLITLTDIASLIPATLISAVGNEEQVVFAPNLSMPYLNASDYHTVAAGLRVGDLAQDRQDFLTLFNQVVFDPTPVNGAVKPWSVSTTPGPFNLYNAVVADFESGLGINSALPNLESAIRITFDPNYTTNFAQGDIVIPFTQQDFNQDGWTNKPRLNQGYSISLSDGTAFNGFLNALSVGETITSVPNNFLIDGADPWIVHAGVPSVTNLAGAVVKYNGQIRSSDIPVAKTGLDRVAVLTFSTDNSVWQGDYSFFYQGPIVLNLTTLSTTVGSVVDQSVVPSKGTGPYTYSITAGTLPDGLSLDSSEGAIVGTASTIGNYQYTLEITDAVGNVCDFAIAHTVTAVIPALAINGSLPNGVVNVPYSQFLDLTGGVTPYSNVGVNGGNFPSGFAIAINGRTIQISGTCETADTYQFTIQVSSADGQTAQKSLKLVITES